MHELYNWCAGEGMGQVGEWIQTWFEASPFNSDKLSQIGDDC
jgi:hypothetical protein